MNNLLAGYLRSRTHILPARANRSHNLATGQRPEAVFITCSDSHVTPEMMLRCEPSQIFPVRNAGNLIPATGDYATGVAATIEYAVRALAVPDIIVCGHTRCGAMRELLEQAHTDDLPEVTAWHRRPDPATNRLRSSVADTVSLPDERRLELITEANVVTQLEHLKQYPAVRDGLRAGSVRLHGWVYDIANGVIQAFRPESGAFSPLLNELAVEQRKVA